MNSKNKLYLSFIIVILLVLSINSKSNAMEIEKSEISAKYQEWLNLSEEEKKNTIAPLAFNVRSKINNDNKNRSILTSTSIPERYDLREHIDIEIKNQMSTGMCWAFSANSALETYLGLKGKTYNFSERHIEYETANNLIGGENKMALNREIGNGGYGSTAFTYYSRGSGPILEEDMPFENNEKPINIKELPTNVAIQKVDDMIYFPNVYKEIINGELIYEDGNKEKYSQTEIANIRKEIKEHIMEYGGISSAVLAPTNLDYYNKKTAAFNYVDYNGFADHAVTIIGWDDTFSRENFNNRPEKDGAYIVLNSYGKNFGENGVYYVSYEDCLIESQLRGVTKVSDINYDEIYQHDISEMWGQIKGKYAANRFTAKSDEKLIQIMIGSLSEQRCNVYINKNENELNINNMNKIAQDVKLNAGYTTIQLQEYINLTQGDTFTIVVELIGSDYTGIGVEDNNAYFGKVTSNLGESFISNNGYNWEDIYDEKDMMNFSIKAFTQKEEPYIEVEDIQEKIIGGTEDKLYFNINTSYLEQGNTVNIDIYNNQGTNITSKFNIVRKQNKGKGNVFKYNLSY